MAYSTISYKGYGEDILKDNVDVNIRLLIGDFSILWNLYENKLFSKQLFDDKEKNNDDRINTIVKNYFEKKDLINDKNYKDEVCKVIKENYTNLLEYLKTHNVGVFDPLRFNEIINYFNIIDSKAWLEENYISSNNNDIESMLKFLLFIIYRVRNNMFHGQKEITKLNLTEDLFNICNNVLILVLEPLEDSIEKYIKRNLD